VSWLICSVSAKSAISTTLPFWIVRLGVTFPMPPTRAPWGIVARLDDTCRNLILRTHRSKGTVIGFWIATALFCLQMSFTA
jgi:hypothetical protein